MDIPVLVTEEQLQAGLIEHSRAGWIPEKYFDWSPPAAKECLDLCGSAAYRNDERSLSVMRREAGEIAHLVDCCTVWIRLGCGQCTKDLVIMRALAVTLPSKAVPFFVRDEGGAQLHF